MNATETLVPTTSTSMLDEYERDQRDQAEAQIASWDGSKGRRIAYVLLSMTWLDAFGATVFPVGLVLALSMALPEIRGWTFRQRFAFAGKRAWTLVACALVGLAILRFTVSVASPGGSIIGAGATLLPVLSLIP